MSEWMVAYDLAKDEDTIRGVQRATLTTKDFGLVPEIALFGTPEWFGAVADGRIPTHRVTGTIARVYFGSMGDWPEFEIAANQEGAKTKWTRFGNQELYRVGAEVILEYVMQRTKRAWSGKAEVSNILRVLIRG